MMIRILAFAMLFSTCNVLAQTPPPGFVPPPLHPDGVDLRVEVVGEGVYALLSSKPPVDNSGFIVGENGVLVIDAHINEMMARKILSAVRSITDKPILYLVNTNYHADHTFGNFAFPKSVRIISHRETAVEMRRFDEHKKSMLVTVRNDKSVVASVELRLPDIEFENYLVLDLGGRRVELYHFGAGNTLGDTVVYSRSASVAWTGNLIFGEGSIPFLLAGDPARYARTLARFAAVLDVGTIVPGHGRITDSSIFAHYLDYLQELIYGVRKAHRENWTLEQALERLTLPLRFAVSPELSSAAFYSGLHPYNVQKTYLDTRL